jgi:hypothetical protein
VNLQGIFFVVLLLILSGCGGTIEVVVAPESHIIPSSTILLVNKGTATGNPEDKLGRLLQEHGFHVISGQIIANHNSPRVSLSPPPEYALEFRCDPFSDASQFFVTDFSAALVDLRSGELVASAVFSGRHLITDVLENFIDQLAAPPVSSDRKPEQILAIPLSRYETDPRVPQWELRKQTSFDPRRIQHVHYIAGLIEEYYARRGIYPLTDKTMPVDVPIARESINYPFPVLDAAELEKELSKVLKRKITLPLDPQRLKAWGFRLYQYHADERGYTVSAHLFYERRDTRKIRDFVHKYQVGSFEDREARIIRFSDIAVTPWLY